MSETEQKTKETIIVSGDEVLLYMNRIKNYLNDLVVDLDRNIVDLQTKIETVANTEQGDETNG